MSFILESFVNNHIDQIVECLEKQGFLIYSDSSEIDTDLMIDQLQRQRYIVELDKLHLARIDHPKFDLKKHICDLFGISYHTSKKDIFILLSKIIKD